MSTTPLPPLMLDPELGFAGDTQVHTQDGLKPIENIRVGDLVLTHPMHVPPPRRRRQRGEYEYRRVTRSVCLEMPSSVRITLKNLADGIEDTWVAAPGQPVWTQPAGWLAACQLRAGHALVLSFNGNALVKNVQAIDQATRMHWLEVDDCHSYYVAQLGSWVSCDPGAVVPAPQAVEAKPAVDFSQPQVLLQIKDYYNGTLADPLPEKTTEITLGDQMHAAAETLRRRLKEQIQVELDYDEAGIRWLDDYIERARQKPPSDQWRNPIHLIGAFLGECTIRSMGGQWSTHDDMYCVVLSEGGAVFPHNKVAKQFLSGREGGDSILGFHEVNLRLNEVLGNKPLTPTQKRLLEHARVDSNNHIFVLPQSQKPAWLPVSEVTDIHVKLQSPPNQRYTTSIFLRDVKSFYACSASGQLLYTESISMSDWHTLPPDILRQLKSKLPRDTFLTLKQLERGKEWIEVSFGASDRKPDAAGHSAYSTTLKNISSGKVRITRFGGFRADEHAWQLASVTGDFYTADQFRDWYGQEDEWLRPGESVCDSANWGDPPVLWAYYFETETGEVLVTGQVLEKPVAQPGGSSGAHFVKPTAPQPDMEQIIQKLRESYDLRQQRMNALTLASLSGPRPAWLNPTDGLAEFFEHQERLLTEGHVVWGALVQANKLLFSPGDANCPGLLVHSPDHYFDARPAELRLIGHTFFSFKHTEPTDPELKAVASLVTDEMDRSMGFELPPVFSSRPVRSATFMVFRKHVPNGVLSHGLFPILTHPSTQAVMMVPFEFWPIELIVRWKENRL